MATSGAYAAPPYYVLSSDNHAGLVVIASLIFLIYAVLSVAAKLFIRLNVSTMKYHDSILLIGAIFYFIETICIIVACNHGIGLHQDAVSLRNLEISTKLEYVSRILALFVQTCTKISVCLLIHHISQTITISRANYTLGGIIVLWAVTGFFTLVFQCHLPKPYLPESKTQCPNRGAIYMYNGVMNVVTDVALCVLPVVMMWGVQTTTKRKIIVVTMFGMRILVPAMAIPSLTTATFMFNDYTDSTWRVVPSLIWFQVSLGLSVLTACIPGLKGVIDSMLGQTAVAAVQAPYEIRESGNGTIELAPLPNQQGSRQSQQQQGSDSAPKLKLRPNSPNQATWSVTRSHDVAPKLSHMGSSGSGGPAGETGRTESVRGLTEGVVYVHGEFEVRYEDHKRSSTSRDSSQGSSAGYHNHI